MKIHSANLDTLPADIAEVQTLTRISDAFPGEGTTATVVVRGRRRSPPTRRSPRWRTRPRRPRHRRVHRRRRDAGRGLRGRRTSVLTLAMPYASPTPRSTTPSGCCARPGPGGARRRRWPSTPSAGRRRVPRLRRPPADRLPVVIGFVLLLTLLMMARVPQPAVALVSTALNLLSVGVAFGDPDPGLPARRRSRPPRLHQPRLRHRLDPALRAGGPGRAVDGLPRVRAQPDPRAGRAADCPTRIAVEQRHPRHGRRGHQRGRRDGVGVRDLRDPRMLEMQMMGVGLAAAILLDATADPAGDAARDPGAAGRPGLVAATPGPPGSRWSSPSRRTSWPVRARCDRSVRSWRSPRARRARGHRRWGRRR